MIQNCNRSRKLAKLTHKKWDNPHITWHIFLTLLLDGPSRWFTPGRVEVWLRLKCPAWEGSKVKARRLISITASAELSWPLDQHTHPMIFPGIPETYRYGCHRILWVMWSFEGDLRTWKPGCLFKTLIYICNSAQLSWHKVKWGPNNLPMSSHRESYLTHEIIFQRIKWKKHI